MFRCLEVPSGPTATLILLPSVWDRWDVSADIEEMDMELPGTGDVRDQAQALEQTREQVPGLCFVRGVQVFWPREACPASPWHCWDRKALLVLVPILQLLSQLLGLS